MTDLTTWIVGAMILVGAFFTLVAAVGLVRLGDVYMRMHAASKAGTLGSGVLLLSIAVHSNELGVITRAIIGVVFFLLTAPVSAHLLARAAYKAGPPTMGPDRDAIARAKTAAERPSDPDGPPGEEGASPST